MRRHAAESGSSRGWPGAPCLAVRSSGLDGTCGLLQVATRRVLQTETYIRDQSDSNRTQYDSNVPGEEGLQGSWRGPLRVCEKEDQLRCEDQRQCNHRQPDKVISLLPPNKPKKRGSSQSSRCPCPHRDHAVVLRTFRRRLWLILDLILRNSVALSKVVQLVVTRGHGRQQSSRQMVVLRGVWIRSDR